MTDPHKTGLPSFDEMAREIESMARGQGDPRRALQSMTPFEAEFGAIVTVFHGELRYQESSPVIEEQVPVVLECLSKLGSWLPELREAVELENSLRCQQLIGRMRRRVHQLMSAFEALRADEQARPKLSPSPYVDALLRSGYAYLEGRLSAPLVLERLRSVMTHLQGFLAGFEQARPDPREQPVWESRREEVEENLDEQLEALSDLEASLSKADADPSEVQEPLQVLARTTQSLYELTQALAAAVMEEHTKNCLRCGAANERSARFCGQCNAMFPVFTTEEVAAPSQVNLTLEEGGVQAGAREYPPHIRRLLELLEGVARGAEDATTLDAELTAAQARLDATLKQLDNLEQPPEDTPADQLQVLDDSVAQMEEGLAMFGEALATARSFFETGDGRVLLTAVEQLTEGAEVLGQLQLKGNSWLSQAQKINPG